MASSSSKAAPKSKKSNEEVYSGFQTLRAEQRQLANKISELEQDLNEHKIVCATLEGVDKDRKCFRLVGGVLVERSVKEVLPELEAQKERLPKAIATLSEQLAAKGKEINTYMEQHDIRLQRGQEPAPQEDQPQAKANVLVAAE